MSVQRWALKSSFKLTAFRRALLSWYRKHGRHDLPWRHTHDPYAVLVSEIMLQQTQVAAVIPYYEKWLERFPDFITLAAVSENAVLHAWQGLGYYSRARNLRAAARQIVTYYDGKCPEDAETLRTLPGLGRYTTNAVLTFAFDQSLPVVEANIMRLLARLLASSEPIDATSGREKIWSFAAQLVPPRNAGQFNSALMDLGATVCLARSPRCTACPVRSFCRGVAHPHRFPKKRPRPQRKTLLERHAYYRRNGRVLLEQCQQRWRGMWMLPALTTDLNGDQPIHRRVFPFTHHAVTLEVFKAKPKVALTNQRWFAAADLDSIPIPSPHRRALDALLGPSCSCSCSCS